MTTPSDANRPMPNHDEWPAFVLPWDDGDVGPTDMSFLLDKPAGAHGFIRCQDGHLVRGDGSRWRAWGVNITFGDPMPTQAQARAISRRLAKFGINCIRLHHMDRRWPDGLIMRRSGPEPDGARMGRDDELTRTLDPEALARMDYFIACCRAQGIYTDLNLNVSRLFSQADGVKQADWLGYGKALTYFDPQLLRLQKEYATQLLGHVNPFTGNRYAEEPAVALVELVNENSILESWTHGRLRGEQRTPFGTWGDIPPAYAADLDRLWNEWLLRHYPEREALVHAWQGGLADFEDPARGSVYRLQPEDFDDATPQRFRDEATFYADMECGYFRDMGAFLRGELGVRQPILGSSDHNHSWHGALHVLNNTELNLNDGHCYWQHPHYGASDYSRVDWTLTNTPMIDAPDHSAPSQLSRSRVLGVPYIVSEINEPFPNDHAAEFIPIMAAYAQLQDWDGVFFYCYGAGREAGWESAAIPAFFPLHNDPVKMPQLAAGALMFLRGDVQPAQEMVAQHLTADHVLDALRADPPDDEFPYSLPWLPGRLALIHGTGIASFDAQELAPADNEIDMARDIIVSDTNELMWLAGGNGPVLVDTPRTQAIVSHGGTNACTNMEIAVDVPLCAVQLSSLDGQDIVASTRMLLVVGGRVANTGMRWADDARQSLTEWGEGPARVEPVTGTVTLRNLDSAVQATLQPLDERGQPAGEAIAFEDTPAGLTVQLPGGTPWYLVTR